MSVITGTLIPAQPTGIDFLKSSNTLIVTDNYGVTTDQIYLTTFKKDFRTSGHLPKCGSLPCPKPAQMQHKDRSILERCPEALSSYTRPQLQAIHRIPAWAKLCTNLRMHADRRQATFCTTQAEGYKRHPSHSAAKLARPTVAIQKCTGDRKLPQTTHRETFPAFIALPVVKAPVKHLGGEPTISGDYDRLYFSTHHKDTFQGRWAPPLAPVEKHFRSSLAMGDPDKLVERETTHAATFGPPSPPEPHCKHL
ncbi:testis-expressed protein 45-like [Clupea harengus]|uniref:Testis-expressed protein 45-like n=1 Tax=Clupea harengus TaxID=7950 RepID=A0A8M1K8D8_CLUHA|nr:testis-expressed protein 45-like [Clupea harengus]